MPRIPLTVSLNVPALVAVFVLSALSLAAAQGEDSYQSRCALCHGGDAAGRQYVAIASGLGFWAFALPK